MLVKRDANASDRQILYEQNFTTEPYGIGLPQGNSDFRDLINYILQQLVLSDEYSNIFAPVLTSESYVLEVFKGDRKRQTIPSLRPVIEQMQETHMITVGARQLTSHHLLTLRKAMRNNRCADVL